MSLSPEQANLLNVLTTMMRSSSQSSMQAHQAYNGPRSSNSGRHKNEDDGSENIRAANETIAKDLIRDAKAQSKIRKKLDADLNADSIKIKEKLDAKLKQIDDELIQAKKDFIDDIGVLNQHEIKNRRNRAEAISEAEDDVLNLTTSYTSELEKYYADSEEHSKKIADMKQQSYMLQRKSASEISTILGLSRRSLAKSQNSFAEAETQSALMTSALMTSHSAIEYGSVMYHQYLDELKTGLNGVSKSYLRQQGMIDEATDEIKSNMDVSQFEEFRTKLGASLSSLEEHVGKFSAMGNVESLLSMNNKEFDAKFSELDRSQQTNIAGATGGSGAAHQEALATTVEGLIKSNLLTDAELTKLGLTIDETTGSLTQSSKQTLKNNEEVRKSLLATITAQKTAARAYDQLAKDANDKNAADVKGFLNLDNAKSKFTDKLTELTSIAGGLALAFSGLKKAYKEGQDFNVAGIPKTFADVTGKAIAMGVSFEEASKFYAENKQPMASMGNESFDKYLSESQQVMRKLGYTDAQSLEFMAASPEAAKAAGVDMSNGDDMVKFVDRSAKAFKRINGLVNMSAAEFQQFNTALADSADMSMINAGLSADETQLHQDEINAVRENLLVQGLTKDQAQAQLLANAQKARQKVGDRVEAAAMMKLQMQKYGLSAEDADAAYKIKMKGSTATEQEKAQLTSFEADVLQAQQAEIQRSGRSGDVAGQLANEVFAENTNAKTGVDSKEAQDLIKARKANTGAKDPNKTAEAAVGNETVAQAGQLVNVITAAWTSSLGMMAMGMAGATVGLILLGKSAIAAAAAQGLGGLGGKLGKLSGLGRLGGLLGGAPPAAAGGAAAGGGLMAGAGAWLSAAAAPLAGAAVIGAGSNMIGNKLKESGHKKTGAAMQVAGYAATGALIGSVIPVVGTAVGAIIGAGVGLLQNTDIVADTIGGMVDSVGSGLTAATGFVGDVLSTGAGVVGTAAGAIGGGMGGLIGAGMGLMSSTSEAKIGEEGFQQSASALTDFTTALINATATLGGTASPASGSFADMVNTGSITDKALPIVQALEQSTSGPSSTLNNTDTIATENITTQTSADAAQMSDADTVMYLKTIAENMIVSVKLLDDILQSNKTSPSGNRSLLSATATAFSALTGRTAAAA